MENIFHNVYFYLKNNTSEFLWKFFQGKDRISLKMFLAYVMVGVFLFIWYSRKKKIGFFKFLFPKEIYTHPSARMDYYTFLIKRIFKPISFIVLPFSTVMVAKGTLSMLHAIYSPTWQKGEAKGLLFLLVCVIGFLLQDFIEYINHKWSHDSSFLWKIHSVHHSAEVLTPFTTKRHNPLFSIYQGSITLIGTGITQGVLVWLLFKTLDYKLFFSLNFIMAFLNYLSGSFRHSHVWFSFGWLNNIFISPAMHQIHHSADPKHRNKNHGLWLSIWDRMFGTIYIPKEKEELTFGLDLNVKNPHDTLFKFFFLPPIEMIQMMWRAIPFPSTKEKKILATISSRQS